VDITFLSCTFISDFFWHLHVFLNRKMCNFNFIDSCPCNLYGTWMLGKLFSPVSGLSVLFLIIVYYPWLIMPMSCTFISDFFWHLHFCFWYWLRFPWLSPESCPAYTEVPDIIRKYLTVPHSRCRVWRVPRPLCLKDIF
jgi:hypothetical protein